VALGEHDQHFRSVSSVSVRKRTIYHNWAMKRLFAALKGKSTQAEASAVDGQSSNALRVEPDDFVNNDYEVQLSYDADLPGQIESQGPGKNVLMPDVHGNEYVVTVPDLKILDLSSSDADESTGFNPYDTAVLRKR
jgi:hypothetical protein